MNGSSTYTKSWVIRLIVVNIAVFFIQVITMQIGMGDPPISASLLMTEYLGLKPKLVMEHGYIWQLATYMFLHGGFFHLFLNMYALLIFGMPVEQAWGSRRFLFYYFFTGIGAGVVIFLINLKFGGAYSISTIGASGAVFGLLLAFGMLFPEAEILLFFLIPMKARLLVILYGGLELYSLISSGGHSPISHAGHLGGLFFGIIYFIIIRKRGITFKSKIIKAKLTREIDRRQQKEPVDDNHEALLR
ncbi:MAG: rhomboid family intramembrane serine protease, partial [Chrysiogenales bacterium]